MKNKPAFKSYFNSNTVKQLEKIAKQHPEYYLIVTQEGNVLSGIDAETSDILIATFTTKEIAEKAISNQRSKFEDGKYYVITIEQLLNLLKSVAKKTYDFNHRIN